MLSAPYGLALDEITSFLYVADRYNNRIQRFPRNRSGSGISTAGSNDPDSNPNQFYCSIDLYLSKIDGSLYMADYYNNSVQKSAQNATTSITIAGSPNETSIDTSYLLNKPYTSAIDDQEKIHLRIEQSEQLHSTFYSSIKHLLNLFTIMIMMYTLSNCFCDYLVVLICLLLSFFRVDISTSK